MTRVLRGLGVIGLAAALAACGSDDKKKPAPCDGGACTDAKRDVAADTQAKLDVADASPDRAAIDQGPDRSAEAGSQPDLVRAEVTVGPEAGADLPPADRPPFFGDTLDQRREDLPITLDGGDDLIPLQLDGPRADTAAIDVNQEDLVPLSLDVPGVDTAATDSAATEAAAIDGGCAGVLCSTFEGDDTDAGVLPAGWTVVGSGAGWTMALDGSNHLLRQSNSSPTWSYIDTGSAWTDQTIIVRVKLRSVGNNDSVRLCGRFAATNTDGYCLNISSASSGTTPGALALQVRSGGNVSVPTGANSSANNLAITVGTWHTYRLVISGAGPVTISAYLDDATTPTVTGTHEASANSPYLTSGKVGIGTRNVTADFDDLVVKTP